jgi:hypothetical protein
MNPANAPSAAARIRRGASFLIYPSIGQPSRATLLVRLAV